jgi:maleylacetoacetate isomerase
MKLYTYFRSSAAFRVRIALNLKGIAYESVGVDLRAGRRDHAQPEYLALNPQGLIPTLQDNGKIISQSLAMLEYLEEVYPEPPLLPKAALERAAVRSMALGIACDIHPLNNLRVLNYLRTPAGLDEEAVKAWGRHWITAGFRGIEEQARRLTGDGQHMFGTDTSLADVCLVPQMYNAVRLKCDLESFPTLRAISAYLQTQTAFYTAAPEAQADAS